MNKTISLFRNIHLSWNIVWISLFAIGMGIFLIGMPKYLDDLWFLCSFGDWFRGNGVDYPTNDINLFSTEFPWKEIQETWRDHYMYDNARLGNIIVVLFLLLPKWIGSLICLGIGIYVIIKSFDICGIDISRSALVPFGLALWYILMPWQNHMGSLVFQFNYIIPSILAIFVLKFIFCRMTKIHQLPLLFVETLIISILFGVWNEAFSIPIISGLTLTLLFYKPLRNLNTYAALTGLTIGLLWLLLTPGFSVRYNALDHSYVGNVLTVIKRFVKIISFHPSIVILIILQGWILLKKGQRNLRKSPFICFVNTSAVGSIILSFLTTGMPRSAWWCDMISVIGILYILQRYYGLYWSVYRKSNIIWGASAMTIVFSSLILTDICVIKTAKECRKIISCFHDNPHGNVYNEWVAALDCPVLMLSKFDTYPEGYLHLIPPYHWSAKELTSGRINVVPERLKAITPSEGEFIPGEGGVKRIDNYYVIEADSGIIGQGKVDLCLDNGRIVDANAVVIPFVSEYDQRKYYNMLIYDRKIERLFHKINSIGKYKDNR